MRIKSIYAEMKLRKLLAKYYAALAKLPKDWQKVANGECDDGVAPGSPAPGAGRGGPDATPGPPLPGAG